MTIEGFFRETPLWALLLLLFLAMALARELGARIRRRAGRSDDKTGTEGESYILSAALGLLALLVAFAFGMALNRHETRRELVVTEANALGSAYLRAEILDDSACLRGMLLQYAEARLAYGLNGGAAQEAAARQAAQLEPQIWAEGIRLVAPNRQTPLAGFILSPLDDAFDAATTRRAALEERMPALVLSTLVIYFIAAASLLGYASASAPERYRIASLALFGLFALALAVILDLDRPRDGLIRIPQGAMVETVDMMRSQIMAPGGEAPAPGQCLPVPGAQR